MQIQAGSTVTGHGTLGCIAQTKDVPPRILAITCQHVVAFWEGKPGQGSLQVWTDGQQVLFYNGSSGGLQISLFIELLPTGRGSPTTVTAIYITTAADTLTTVAANVAAAVNALANPSVSATSAVVDTGSQVIIAPAAGFKYKADCRIVRWGSHRSQGIPEPTRPTGLPFSETR